MTNNDWRALNGGLLLVCLCLPMLFRDLARWPWFGLVPLLVYAAVVSLIAPLRRSLKWLRFGRLDPTVLAVTAGIVLVCSGALVAYYFLFQPDLALVREHLPLGTGVILILAGAGFSLLNATIEEVVYLGILLDALASQVSLSLAVMVQAAVFGMAHYQGYPPGPVGVVLAAIYGLVLGALRQWAQGLAAPVVAHVFADATIYAIVMNAT